jgi:hypothetical protein
VYKGKGNTVNRELEKLEDVTFIPAPAKDAIFKYLENPDQPAFFFSDNK